MDNNEYPKTTEIGSIVFTKAQEEFDERDINALKNAKDLSDAINILLDRQTAILNACRTIIHAMIENNIPLSKEMKSIIECGKLKGEN